VHDCENKIWLGSRTSGIPRRLVMAKYSSRKIRVLRTLGSCIAYVTPADFEKPSEERAMDGDYVFLCGVMWCCYGQEDARSELQRAADSADPDLSALALAMLRQRGHSLHQHTA
jgi:hypothetical protein